MLSGFRFDYAGFRSRPLFELLVQWRREFEDDISSRAQNQSTGYSANTICQPAPVFVGVQVFSNSRRAGDNHHVAIGNRYIGVLSDL